MKQTLPHGIEGSLESIKSSKKMNKKAYQDSVMKSEVDE